MKCNVGKREATIRVLVAALIFSVGIHFHSWWGLLGLIPLVTAIVRWCPVSAAIGVSTCKS